MQTALYHDLIIVGLIALAITAAFCAYFWYRATHPLHEWAPSWTQSEID